jgi:regulator of PEP synthase PpsR (kinase-PPPase family)
MSNTYQIYLISDSTGETLDRIFLALKAQFKNIEYKSPPIFFYKNSKPNNKNSRDSKKK